MNRNYLIVGFAALVIAQLFVPGKMIWDQERVLASGTEIRLRTQPIDPNDPFRGKYVTLNFTNNEVAAPAGVSEDRGKEIYVTFRMDTAGFSIPDEVTFIPPVTTDTYLKTTVQYFTDYEKGPTYVIDYPFNRFYMEESKAPTAEVIYRDANRWDNEKEAAGIVAIKDGMAVLKDVRIDGVSLVDLSRQANQE